MGCRSGGGWEGRWLSGHTSGACLCLFPDWRLFETKMPHPEPQAGTWQKREEERSLTHWSCHLMKAQLRWGRPQATDVGGGPAKAVCRAGE